VCMFSSIFVTLVRYPRGLETASPAGLLFPAFYGLGADSPPPGPDAITREAC
jgi:hypothetical protein